MHTVWTWGPRLVDHWDKTQHYPIGKSVSSHLIPRLVPDVHQSGGDTGRGANVPPSTG